MPRIKGTNDAQSSFLRACVKSPLGLEQQNWPSAVKLRRWLRRPGFRAALQGLRDSLRIQSDMHLAAASAAASKQIADVVSRPRDGEHATTEELKVTRDLIHSLASLLRLAHLRQRFSTDIPLPPRRAPITPEMKEALEDMRYVISQRAHPDMTVGEAKRLLKILNGDTSDADEDGDSR